MEARKVQITGGSTYTVSLPKHWAKSMNLKQGDMIFFEPLENALILRTEQREKKEPRTKVLHIEKGERREHVVRKLIGAYVTGYQFIELRFGSSEAATARRAAREFSRMVIGAEVVEETGGRVLIQDLANPMELSPDKCLRRMYMTVRSMAEDSIVALKAADPTRAEDVPPRDQDVDRLYWMVAKQYHLAVTDPSYMVTYSLRGKLHHFRTVAKLLERVGDHAEKIALAVIQLEGEDQDDTFLAKVDGAVHLALGILEKAFTALMAENMDMANEALDAWETLYLTVEELTQEVSGAPGPRLLPLATIMDSISRIGGYASDIAEVAINNVISQEE
ncbi:MAG: phosphate uptake regulator PhoU [Candidatus Thermoplasmatota archaeon]|nr:phosphate uptake regulator PhoU [Candidatus Thermoplasmatota archaeon]